MIELIFIIKFSQNSNILTLFNFIIRYLLGNLLLLYHS